MAPSRPVLLYDRDIDPKEVQVLQFAYTHAFEIPHQEQYLLRLLRIFAHADVYGLSIKHPALRYAVCTYSGCYMEHPESFSQLQYYGRALKALKRKLSDPASVDEGDLFAIALLAMWSGNMCMDDEFQWHTRGFIAMMDHLTHKASTDTSSNRLSIFWPMARDELILHAYDVSSDSGVGIIDSVAHTLCRSAHQSGGHEAFRATATIYDSARQTDYLWSGSQWAPRDVLATILFAERVLQIDITRE